MQTFLYTLHFIVCFVLIGSVLLQRGKGADLGASLGGGGANTIFGSRGAGNFLSRITTASAIIFMGTSLTLAYLGYQASDVKLFDGDAPIDLPDAPGLPGDASGGLEEIPSALEEVTDQLGETAKAAQEGAEALVEAAGDAASSAASDAADAGSALEAAAEDAVTGITDAVRDGAQDAEAAAE